MSEDVLRHYQRGAQGGRGLSWRRKRRPFVRYSLLLLFVGLPLTALWLTRDSWDMGLLIPKDQHYALLFPDLIEGRKIIARSPLWQALPPELDARKFQEMLQQDFGLPEWLINNVAVGAVHVSGRDMTTFKDALVVTRMTRLGALLQRFSGWSDSVEPDFAGGLELRHITEAGLWLAVRGRVMLASRDRDALIKALVLSEGEALGAEVLEETLGSASGEMLQARVKPESLEWAAAQVNAAGLQCWLSDDAARAVLTCRLSDALRQQLEPLLSKARPVALQAPLPGALRISADFGMPAAQAWQAIAQSFGANFDAAAAAESLMAKEAQPIAGAALRGAVESLGNQWSLSYRGVNPMAFAPMPRFAALLSADAEFTRDLVRNFPPLPEGIGTWESIPRPSADGTYVELPLIGGMICIPCWRPMAASCSLPRRSRMGRNYWRRRRRFRNRQRMATC